MVLYGISNCDTIRKAKKWLSAQGVDYQFHDFRKDGLEPALLKKWAKQAGWEVLLNKRGTTWRKLPEDVRNHINESSAIDMMLELPTMIKRPVLVNSKNILIGFNEEQYKQFILNK